jgi:4-hydroxy-tetrahydrodipicolinate synthase
MFHGSMVALVTPMQADGGLDYAALERLIEFHIANGTDGIVAVGTTGESATLDMEEHCVLLRRAVEIVAGRVPLIAGTGANSTSEAIDLTRCAMQAGADACLLVTPYYNKPTQEGLYLHHKAVAEAVAIPQILYNVPGRTAVDMQPETIVRLATVSNIVGVKEATGDIARVAKILDGAGDKLDIYSGDDATSRALLLAGGRGVISVTANVAPHAMHAMCAAALAGDTAEAERIDATLAALHRDLFCESNPIPVKWALAQMGLIPDGIRLPLTPLSAAHHATVRAALAAAGIATVE